MARSVWYRITDTSTNPQLCKNNYPLLLIGQLVDKLQGSKLFTKMDLRWGYNNVRIKEGNEWKAAFVCFHGAFEPLVVTIASFMLHFLNLPFFDFPMPFSFTTERGYSSLLFSHHLGLLSPPIGSLAPIT